MALCPGLGSRVPRRFVQVAEAAPFGAPLALLVPPQLRVSHVALPAELRAGDVLRVLTRTGRLASERALKCQRAVKRVVSLLWRMILGVSNHFSERIRGSSVKLYDSNSFPLTELTIRKSDCLIYLSLTRTSSLSSSK